MQVRTERMSVWFPTLNYHVSMCNVYCHLVLTANIKYELVTIWAVAVIKFELRFRLECRLRFTSGLRLWFGLVLHYFLDLYLHSVHFYLKLLAQYAQHMKHCAAWFDHFGPCASCRSLALSCRRWPLTAPCCGQSAADRNYFGRHLRAGAAGEVSRPVVTAPVNVSRVTHLHRACHRHASPTRVTDASPTRHRISNDSRPDARDCRLLGPDLHCYLFSLRSLSVCGPPTF